MTKQEKITLTLTSSELKLIESSLRIAATFAAMAVLLKADNASYTVLADRLKSMSEASDTALMGDGNIINLAACRRAGR